MDLVDILKSFSTRLPEEISDSESYLTMAKHAEEMGQKELMIGLYAIAKDEYTHARFIYNHLCGAGIDIPKETCDKYKLLEEHIYNMFYK